MATKPNKDQAAIFNDPLDKWSSGGDDFDLDSAPEESRSGRGRSSGGFSSEFKSSMFEETRHVTKKIREIERQMRERSLTKAERRALNNVLRNSQEELHKMRQAVDSEVKILRESAFYQRDANRKLNALRQFMKDEQSRKTGPMTKTQEEDRKDLFQNLGKVEHFLESLTKQEIGTDKGRRSTAKMLTRVEQYLDRLPGKLREEFEKQEELSKRILEQNRKDYEERFNSGLEAWRRMEDRKNKFKDNIKDRSLAFLDNLGYGKLSVGSLVRGGMAANSARKRWKNGQTGFQRFMQDRTQMRGGDIKSLRFGLGNTQRPEVSDDERYSQWLNKKNGGNYDRETLEAIKSNSQESARFHSRFLEALERRSNKDSTTGQGGFLSNIADMVKNAFGSAIGSFLPTSLKSVLGALVPDGIGAALKGLLPGALRMGLAFLTSPLGIIAGAAGALVYLVKSEQDKIKENPNAPEYKNNPYAMTVRGEAKSVGQAGEINRKRALKTLQPGTAKEYLDAGIQADGKYLEGYTKSQLEDMAAGREPKEPLTQFEKVQNQNSSAGQPGQADVRKLDTQLSSPESASSSSNGGSVSPTSSPSGSSSGQTMGQGGLLKDSKVFTKNGDVNTDGLNAGFQSTLSSMGQEYYDKTGKKIQINSAYRSPEEQAQLYKSKPPGMAAAPGSSLHNYGMAIDMSSQTANELDKLGLLSKYGLHRPIKGEPWHVQPKGMTLAAAKAGIYSADSPKDQGASKEAKATMTASGVSQPADPSTQGATPVAETGSGSTNADQGKTRSTSASSIPTFDVADSSLLAMNLGVL